MAKILHLEEDPAIRKKMRDILTKSGHQVTSVDAINEAATSGGYNLYVCGPLNKQSDGLGFAVDMLGRGRKVLIMASLRKFSRVRFLSTHALSNTKYVRGFIESLLAED
ncbi:MAG: hypothetical protein M3Q24_00455 [bacterium]|nr:hypothetical protein [bacterium]